MTTIATVLRSGGEFTPEHVQELRHAVATNLHRPHRFVCLSDLPVPGIEVIPLAHDWPTWWPKVELFRTGIFEGPVMFFDLDTWITGSLDAFAEEPTEMAMLSDFYHPSNAASGMMMWVPSPATEEIYWEFLRDPAGIMRRLEGSGDQAWIRSVAPDATRIQNLFPGKVVSWKVHCAEGGIPPTASVVCFHGKPRPWEVQAETIAKHSDLCGKWLASVEEEGVEILKSTDVHTVVALTVLEVGGGRDVAIRCAGDIFDELGETDNGFWVATYPGGKPAEVAA